jgi:hypothetical protein
MLEQLIPFNFVDLYANLPANLDANIWDVDTISLQSDILYQISVQYQALAVAFKVS